MEKLSFGEALNALESGRLVAREGWNGKKMFIFQRPVDYISVDMLINRIKSLPESVKEWYNKEMGNNPDLSIMFTPYLCMKAADNSIVNGWLASQTDMTAKDWYIL